MKYPAIYSIFSIVFSQNSRLSRAVQGRAVKSKTNTTSHRTRIRREESSSEEWTEEEEEEEEEEDEKPFLGVTIEKIQMVKYCKLGNIRC